ncbi:MAG: DinB family protein, partial [Bacteroidota bacterium]
FTMKPRSASELLEKLTARTQQNLAAGEAFMALDEQTLHLRPRPNAWNVLDCLAHLNHYGDYYLPEISKQIAASKYRTNTETFTSSRLGNYFASGMKPGPKTRKISTFKSANPINFTTPPGREAITEFIRQQKEMLELLELASKVDLTKTKTGISITNLIKLRLGDTLRVVVYHNWRHVVQAQEAIGLAVDGSAIVGSR